ncbi:MAG: ATP-dependent DNA ligase, partial [Chloroflexota bacterium]|nr:ATP-dependent DNA ligase [Chloroflexota bacterium]
MTDTLRVDGRTITVTHGDRVVFPDDGVTKGEIVEHYRRVARQMLPHLRGRPVSMQRVRDNIDAQVFYQKDAPAHFPDWIRRVTVPKVGGTVAHVVCDDAAALVYIANQGCVTPHVWLSRVRTLQAPDRMIIDLDPGAGGVADARFAARLAREVLTDAIERRAPHRLTTEFYKAERAGRLFLDVNRNAWAQTAVPPYAIRPKPGAPVAVPLIWEELESTAPDAWSVRTIARRLADVPDPWRGFGPHMRTLGAARRWLARDGGSNGPV